MRLVSLSAPLAAALLTVPLCPPPSSDVRRPAMCCSTRSWPGPRATGTATACTPRATTSGSRSSTRRHRRVARRLLLSDADSILRYAFTGTLAAGARRVVFGLEAVEWQRATGRTISGLSLNNSGETVRLFLAMGADTVMVDAYGYKSHEAVTDRASGRRPDGGAWALFDGLNVYTGSLEPASTQCLPTPRTTNQCGPTPVHPGTWGRLKATYR